ncbi:MAG: ABC transporter permease [Acidobacteria bacterium]|nr:ABC transporter permease [Acidobacteriota bacterium]
MNLRKLRAIFQRNEMERELDLELTDHLAQEAETLMAAGIPEDEARRRALATMGKLPSIREECRDSRGIRLWDELRQDARFALRLLGRNRMFAALSLATIALGIGSTTAIGSLVDAVLIRPLPFPAPGELYAASDVGMRGPLDVLRANAKAAEYAGYLGARDFTTLGEAGPERTRGVEVTANFFRMLGAVPLLGRTFTGGEDGRRVAVLSHRYWRRQFQGRPDVVGVHFSADEIEYEVVGVMPAAMTFPAESANFWVPMRMDPRLAGEYWGTGGVMAIARLRAGQTAVSASAELRSWVPRIRGMFPWRMPDAWGTGAGLTLLQESLSAGSKVPSLLLLGAVFLVLLIGIVNVANLLTAQAAARQREFTMRVSLGATSGRIARQLLTEAMLLALAGGLGGVVLAYAGLPLLQHWMPAGTPRIGEATLDARVLAFSAVLALGSGLLFGLWPLLRSRRAGSGAALLVAEAAFATMLLIGGGLLLRSLWLLMQVSPGFRPESIVTAEFTPSRSIGASLPRVVEASDSLRAKLLAFPGVRDAAATNVLPVTPEISAFTAAIEDHPRPPQDPQIPLWSTAVSPAYLDTLGVRLLRGRGFTEADRAGSELVVMIGQQTARRYWPDRSPIGRRLKPVWERDWRTIVGVVEDVKHYGLKGPPDWIEGEVYLPLAQAVVLPRKLSIAVRVEGPTENVEARLPVIVREICAQCAVSKIARMESVVSGAARAPRSLAWLVTALAGLALVMAAAGIYGVVSHSVIRRTKEIGVRMALGAAWRHVAWEVARPSVVYTALGAAIGFGLSWGLAKLVKSLLFGIAEHDGLTFSAAPVVLVAVAAASCVYPILRALRIDPARCLREG